jgi:hypothetical protein
MIGNRMKKKIQIVVKVLTPTLYLKSVSAQLLN